MPKWGRAPCRNGSRRQRRKGSGYRSRSQPRDQLDRRQVDQGDQIAQERPPGQAEDRAPETEGRQGRQRCSGWPAAARAIRLADAAPSSRCVTATTTVDMLGNVLTSPAHRGAAELVTTPTIAT